MRGIFFSFVLSASLLCGCAASPRAAMSSSDAVAQDANGPTTGPLEEATIRRPSLDKAIDDGVRYLVRSQNADGSWGTGTVTRGTEIMSMVPGSHDAYR